jgi:uncharacterized DUF497 family protein
MKFDMYQLYAIFYAIHALSLFSTASSVSHSFYEYDISFRLPCTPFKNMPCHWNRRKNEDCIAHKPVSFAAVKTSAKTAHFITSDRAYDINIRQNIVRYIHNLGVAILTLIVHNVIALLSICSYEAETDTDLKLNLLYSLCSQNPLQA